MVDDQGSLAGLVGLDDLAYRSFLACLVVLEDLANSSFRILRLAS
jgi:hypothetical protein